MFLLIFCFDDQSIGINVLKSPTIDGVTAHSLLCLFVLALCIEMLLYWVHNIYICCLHPKVSVNCLFKILLLCCLVSDFHYSVYSSASIYFYITNSLLILFISYFFLIFLSNLLNFSQMIISAPNFVEYHDHYSELSSSRLFILLSLFFLKFYPILIWITFCLSILPIYLFIS